MWARVRLPVAAVSHSGPPATRGAEGVHMEGRTRNLPLSALPPERATPVRSVRARSIENPGGRKTGLGTDARRTIKTGM